MADENGAPTKTCPYCAETILATAVKCKHCGEFLTRVPGRTSDYQWTRGRKIAAWIVVPILLLPLLGLVLRACQGV